MCCQTVRYGWNLNAKPYVVVKRMDLWSRNRQAVVGIRYLRWYMLGGAGNTYMLFLLQFIHYRLNISTHAIFMLPFYHCTSPGKHHFENVVSGSGFLLQWHPRGPRHHRRSKHKRADPPFNQFRVMNFMTPDIRLVPHQPTTHGPKDNTHVITEVSMSCQSLLIVTLLEREYFKNEQVQYFCTLCVTVLYI